MPCPFVRFYLTTSSETRRAEPLPCDRNSSAAQLLTSLEEHHRMLKYFYKYRSENAIFANKQLLGCKYAENERFY